MRTNYLFVLIGVLTILLFPACEKNSDVNLDKKLNFSNLPVEQQKQKIESSGIDFVDAMEGLLETEAFTVIESALAVIPLDNSGSEILYVLRNDLKAGNAGVLTNLDRQMKVVYEDDDFTWGEYAYNFQTEEIELIRELNKKIIIKLPASEDAYNNQRNNATISFEYSDSSVTIPYEEEFYPKSAQFLIKVDNKNVLEASFSGSYFDDGMPKKLKQSLTIDAYTWELNLDNNKKKASSDYQFKKAKQILIRYGAELTGRLSFEDFENAAQNDEINNLADKVAAYFQVMDVAVKGGFNDVKALANSMNNISHNLSDEAYANKVAEVLNQQFVGYAYFVNDNKKFADLEFYAQEYERESEWNYFDTNGNPITVYETGYDVLPRFVLNDGSKVSVEEFINTGFEDLIDRINEIAGNIE